MSLLPRSFVTGLPSFSHCWKRHQEPGVQRRDPDHPQRSAQPQPRGRWWLVSYFSLLHFYFFIFSSFHDNLQDSNYVWDMKQWQWHLTAISQIFWDFPKYHFSLLGKIKGKRFFLTLSLFCSLSFPVQMRGRASTLWRSTCSCRLCSIWQPNPSATPSAPSASKFTRREN